MSKRFIAIVSSIVAIALLCCVLFVPFDMNLFKMSASGKEDGIINSVESLIEDSNSNNGDVNSVDISRLEGTSDSTRQVEELSRGLVAVKTDEGILVSWRLLGSESYSATFCLYRDGIKIADLKTSTNYLDKKGKLTSAYYVTKLVDGKEVEKSQEVKPWEQNYIDIPVDKIKDVTDENASYTYSINDASVADVDDDGEYEIFIKWEPSNAKDGTQAGDTGKVYLDCYEMDGKRLWRIDFGVNIRAGAQYLPFLVYDFDGNGKAEMICKTAYGTKDGKGMYVNKADDDKNKKDYRNSNGHIVSGEEFITVFEGETGEALYSTKYIPQRGEVNSWGDSAGNNSETFLGTVAYLDGQNPYIVVTRGNYARTAATAYAWNGRNLEQKWLYDTNNDKDNSLTAYAQGATNVRAADVDNDGYDEIVYGSSVIDHNGKLLYSTKRGYGTNVHVSDFNNDGRQEIFMIHEDANTCKEYGVELRDGKTGDIITKIGANNCVTNGLIANISSTDGYEIWSSSDSKLYSVDGKAMGTKPLSTNFSILWDDDLYSELLDGTILTKYIEKDGKSANVTTLGGTHSINSVDTTPCLQADIFGDYREEIVMAGADDTFVRIYTTDVVTLCRLYTLMHDTQYRCAVAAQNAGNNESPDASYYIGEDMYVPGMPNVHYGRLVPIVFEDELKAAEEEKAKNEKQEVSKETETKVDSQAQDTVKDDAESDNSDESEETEDILADNSNSKDEDSEQDDTEDTDKDNNSNNSSSGGNDIGSNDNNGNAGNNGNNSGNGNCHNNNQNGNNSGNNGSGSNSGGNNGTNSNNNNGTNSNNGGNNGANSNNNNGSNNNNWNDNKPGNQNGNSSQVANIKDGAIYTIQNVNSGLYLNVYGNRAINKTNVIQYSKSVTPSNEQWRLVHVGDGYYRVYSQVGDGNTFLLDVDWGRPDNGTNIQIHYDTNTDAQLFKFELNSDGSYTIFTKASGCRSVLDVEYGSMYNNANVQQWGYNGGSANQKWILKEVTSNNYGSADNGSNNSYWQGSGNEYWSGHNNKWYNSSYWNDDSCDQGSDSCWWW